MKTRKERIEKAIERNRQMILKGGDRKYYSKKILNLNQLLSNIDKEGE